MYDKFDKQKPFAILDTSKYPPEVAGRFNSFITTQFDDSLSVEMQMRSVIKWAIDNFKDMDQTYNDFTEYLIKGNLNPFIQFLNDLIEYMNEFVETFDTKFQDEILLNLQKWYDDGTLETLINETLDTKYHEMDNRLSTQLSQMEQQKVDKDGSMQVYWANLAQDAREQINGDKPPAIVGVDSVGADNIINKSLSVSKLNYYDVVTENLFNSATRTLDYSIGSTGNIITSDTADVSDFIPVKPNEKYVMSHSTTRLFYDVDKIEVGFESFEAGRVFTTGTNVLYVRVAVPKTLTNSFMFSKGVLPPEYSHYGKQWVKSNDNIVRLDEFDGRKIEPQSIGADKLDYYDLVTENLFNPATATLNSISFPSGNIITSSTFYLSDYVAIKPSTTYHSNYMGSRNFYDINKQFIQTESWEEGASTTTPSNAHFIRLTVSLARLFDMMFVEGTLPDKHLPYGSKLVELNDKIVIQGETIDSKLKGRKWSILGDSITDGTVTWFKFHDYIAERTGVIVEDKGISGSTVTSGGNNPMVSRYETLDPSADIITVFGGVNDSVDGQVPLGDIDSTDTTTFYGAYNTLIEGIIKRYPTKLITTFTPLKAADRPDRHVEDIATVVKEVSAKYGVACLDLNAMSGLNPHIEEQNTFLYNDGLHPNTNGHKKFSYVVESFLERLVDY